MRRSLLALMSRQVRGEVIGVLLIALALIVLQLAVWVLVLDRATAGAEQAGLVRVRLAAETIEQAVRRQIDALDRFEFNLSQFAHRWPEGSAAPAYFAQRLRRLALDRRYNISTVAHFNIDPALDWHADTGPEARGPSDADAIRNMVLPPDTLVVGDPELAAEPTNWLIPVYFRPTLDNGTVAGVGLLTLDGAELSATLGRLVSWPGQQVAMWRQDGRYLAGSVNGVMAVQRRLTAPARPGPDGRIQLRLLSLLNGEDRFVAFKQIENQGLFISVSSPAAYELTSYYRFRTIMLSLEASVVALIIGTAFLVLILRSRARVRLALSQAETEQDAFERQHAELEHILDGVDAGVYRMRVGPGDRFVRYDYNAGVARLIGRTMEEVGKVRGVLAFAEPQPTEAHRLASLVDLQQTGHHTYEAQIRCGDGHLRWMRFQLRVVGHDGDIMECVGLMTDIEVEKAATASAIMAARLATLGELSAGIAHEMKQPLTVIALLAETTESMLSDEPDTPPPPLGEIAKMQRRIVTMVQRATAITDHLRGVARGQDSAMEPVSLPEAVDGALMLCRSSLREAQIDVTIDIPAELPLVIGRLVLIEQVLMNLLMNARDAMATIPAGDRRVAITAGLEDDVLRVRVHDSGPGIPLHVLPRLFQAFFTTKPVGVGTGLGLSICLGILKSCGGDIVAANPSGGGAEFTLTLLRADRAGHAAAT